MNVTEGMQGNRERMAFLYDSRKTRFGVLAGEIVVPAVKKLEPAKQLARTPFMISLQAGCFKFPIYTTRILYGKAEAEDPNRLEETRVPAGFLTDQATEKYMRGKNKILLGGSNILHERPDLKGEQRRRFRGAKAVTEAAIQRAVEQTLRPDRFCRARGAGPAETLQARRFQLLRLRLP